MSDSLADRIRKARTIRRFSQSKVAVLLGVNRATVAKWEMQRKQLPSSQNLIKLARLLQVSHEWLVAGAGRMEPVRAAPAAGDYAPSPRTLEEERLLQLYRLLPKQQRKIALKFVETAHYSTWRGADAVSAGPAAARAVAAAVVDLPVNCAL